MPRTETVKKYWESEKSQQHREKLRESMREFWRKIKKLQTERKKT